MRIRLRCLPGYETLLPRPVLAAEALPAWLKTMPARSPSETLGGVEVRTVKQCPPFLDAMRAGILFPLAADLHVQDGELAWSWNLPPHEAARPSRSPVGVHVPEQAGALAKGQFVVKFTNYWTVELPQGFSLLVNHPFNREDLPFRTLTGLVDADRFTDGFIHFPALWIDPEFAGTLKAGTPVAQAVPVRREALALDIGSMDGAALERHLEVQDALQVEPGLYRKRYRA